MKNTIKKLLPSFIFTILRGLYIFLRRLFIKYLFFKVYMKDMKRYLRHSRTLKVDNPDKIIGAIVLQYHVVEKGLTMPDTRPGFGKDRLISLSESCLGFISNYGSNDQQLQHAVAVVLEYELYHRSIGYQLSSDVNSAIMRLKEVSDFKILPSNQINTTKDKYFKHVNDPFPLFSGSRSSVRNFTTEELTVDRITDAIDIARNTPSACNRQSWRTYVYSNKNKISQLLEAQGGNRGFGHLTNKLIVIAGEMGVFSYLNERNQVFVDGGMYAMNLLYALHSQKVAACILNCSFDFNKELQIKKMGNIRDSEVLIAMIACGNAPGEFKIARSPRYASAKTNKFID